jgi:toxin ParE1/3/4
MLSPQAEHDLDDIKKYLVQEAGVRVARYVLREIKGAMQFLAGARQAGHRRPDLTDADVRFWPVFSYLIVYDPTKGPIEIVRILHGKRNVAAILK